jgi:hypothetical protein
MIQQPLLSKDQYRYLGKQIIRSIETKFRILPLNSLKHPKYRLKTPVYISIEFENDQVIDSLDDEEIQSDSTKSKQRSKRKRVRISPRNTR